MSLYFPKAAHADLTDCSVNLSPQSVAPNSDNFFTFGIFNSSTNPIQWVQITTPGGNYETIESAGAGGWSEVDSASQTTFTGGSLSDGSSQGFVVEGLAGGNTTSSPVDWTVQASDDPGGVDAITCDGDTSMSVAEQPSVINISNVADTNVFSNKVTITWDTDVASTSEVDYGLDTNYGSSTSTNNTLVTSHSVTLTRLVANTGYHFQVTSTTPDGGTSTSGDNTFLTADAQAGEGSSSSGGGTTDGLLPSTSNSVPLLAVPVETTPPTVSITSKIPRVQKTMPTVTGEATDKVAVASVQFSTDNGVNWLPAQQVTGIGSKHVTFSFAPVNLDDGTYNLVVRAINTSGVIAKTPATVIVIDRLDPLIGPNVVSLGPQILTPDRSGVVTTMAGVDQKVTLSTVGGPIKVTVAALSSNGKHKVQVYDLTKDSTSGLWSGIVSFASPGSYSLLATAVDGANVRASRTLNEFNVIPAARTVDAATNKSVSATVKVYYYDQDTNSWVLWDGGSYGQKDPQRSGKQGGFNLFLPPGKYYLTAAARGYHTLSSSIFTTTQTTPINTVFRLKSLHGFSIGPFHIDFSLPTLADQAVSLTAASTHTKERSLYGSLVGKIAPNFTLSSTNGNTISAANLLGKPTVLTFGTTWSPTTAEQVGALSQLQTDKNINVVPIAVQQGVAITHAYTIIAGLNLNWLADPNSTLTTQYNVQGLPTNFFISREGIIKKVVVGVMSRQQILNTLADL